MKKIFFFAALAFAFAQCSSENNANSATSAAPTTSAPDTAAAPTPAANTEPIFLSEGELSFKDANGKELTKIEIEIVENDADRQKGLMFRKQMLESRGMLFIFDAEEPQSFWMHNTYVSLDIIYVGKDFKVVSIQKNAKTLNDTPLPSDAPAQYVVEVNAGFSEKFGIKKGVLIEFKNYNKL